MYLSVFLTLALDADSPTITVCLITTPYPLPKPVFYAVWSNAPSFNFQYLLVLLRSYSSCLHLLPHLLITYILGWILEDIILEKHYWYLLNQRHDCVLSWCGCDKRKCILIPRSFRPQQVTKLTKLSRLQNM